MAKHVLYGRNTFRSVRPKGNALWVARDGVFLDP